MWKMFLKLFLEMWSWPPVTRTAVTSIYMLIMISRESMVRNDSLQQTQLMHIFQHVRKRYKSYTTVLGR